MKYRKKPVVIDAMKFDSNYWEIRKWVNGENLPPEANEIVRHTPSPDLITIETLEGTLYASKGDWIIRGIKGEYYPCKPDIFEMTYEEVPPSPRER